MEFKTITDLNRWRRYERDIEKLKKKGVKVISAVIPCCGNRFESQAPKPSEVWGSITVCPFCGTLIFRAANEDELTFECLD